MNPTSQHQTKLTPLILSFALVKLLTHFLTNTHYGLHRDAYLYYEMRNHLDWGYLEVPPMIALLAKGAELLGGSIFAIRLFPALIGALTIFLAGVLVKELGGKKWAVVFTCGGLLLSPAFLWGNTLFQPVSFNQFFWFLSAYWLVKISKTDQPKYWYALGITAGIALLTKYSIAFYFTALFIGILFSPLRKWLLRPQPWLALLIALAIFTPNLIWQFQHNFPLIHHMRELAETQLVNIRPVDFILPQFLFHLAGIILWLSGLIYTLFHKEARPYRWAGWALLFTLILIGLASGKSYYTIGAYTVLFVFGGIALEKLIVRKSIRVLFLATYFLMTLPFIPYSLPVLKLSPMVEYCAFMKEKMGFDMFLRWEDGRYYPIPQDFADMHAWEEMVANVGKVYHSLTEEEKDRTQIFGGSYGHAGAINYFKKKYDLPGAVSFSSSFLLWAPDEADFDAQLMIDNYRISESEYFESVELLDSNETRFARDPGYIYLFSQPRSEVPGAWKRIVADLKKDFE
jgi:hypothetical protein